MSGQPQTAASPAPRVHSWGFCFFKKKNTKIEYWAQICIFTAFYIFTVASGFILLFGATGKLLPPAASSTAVQSLQPFPDITQDFRQTLHLAIFSWWVHVCASDSRTPAFQLCVLRWNGLCKGAPAEPNLRKWVGGLLEEDGSVYLIKGTNAARHTIKCKVSWSVFVFSFLSADCVSCVGWVQSLTLGWRLVPEFRHFQVCFRGTQFAWVTWCFTSASWRPLRRQWAY